MAESPTPSPAPSPRSLRRRFTARLGAIVAGCVIVVVAACAWVSRALLDAELTARARLAADALAITSLGAPPDRLKTAAALALERLPDGAFVALRGEGGGVLALAVDRGLRLEASELGEARAGSARREVGSLVLEESTAASPGAQGPVRFAQVGVRRGPTVARAARVALGLGGLGFVAWLASLFLAGLASRALAGPPGRAPGAARAGAEDLPAAPQKNPGSANLDVQKASAQIAARAEELYVAAEGQTQAANLQWDSMHHAGQALEELTATRRLAVDHTAALIQRAQEAEELSSEGMRVIGEALSALQDLSQDVREIAQSIARQSDFTVQVGSIASAVKDLAEQSNLLALNAAVEAARAGERGLGFAVVAQEMRGLAAQSKEASARIRSTLADANRAMRESLKLAEASGGRAERAGTLALGAGEFIGKIAEAVRESYLGAKEIESSTQQQTRTVDEIAAAMAGLSSTAQRARDGSAELSRVASELGDLSRRLAALLQRGDLELPCAEPPKPAE